MNKNNENNKPINLKDSSYNNYSGFLIVRLSQNAISTDSNNISELAKQKNSTSLINLFEKYKSADITSRPLVKNTSKAVELENKLALKNKSSKSSSSHSLTSY